MSTGPAAKGPRLWLQPARDRAGRKPEPAVWVIRDDGGLKRSTGCAADDRGGAERALARYLAERHQPARRQGDPAEVLILDVLNLYGREIAPRHGRPKETASRLKRLGLFWGQPAFAMRRIGELGLVHEKLTGMVADVRTGTCQAYVRHVGATRSARMDLELLRAAMNHAVREQVLGRALPVWLPEDSQPRDRWLNRSEVARLLWAAWRFREKQKGIETDKRSRRHLARWMLCALYTGTRKAAILYAAFQQKPGFGFIDLDAGVWHRQAVGKRRTKKRQPVVPLPAPLLAHMRRWKKNGQAHPVEHNGAPIDRMDKAFRNLVKDAGFGADVVPHTFRHTAITWAMQRAMDPWAASGFFGITLEELTRTYGHHHPDHLREAAETMGRRGIPLRSRARAEVLRTR